MQAALINIELDLAAVFSQARRARRLSHRARTARMNDANASLCRAVRLPVAPALSGPPARAPRGAAAGVERQADRRLHRGHRQDVRQPRDRVVELLGGARPKRGGQRGAGELLVVVDAGRQRQIACGGGR
eukprot:2156325-Prymnesium_polylepis.1